jgi:hypothetical protein
MRTPFSKTNEKLALDHMSHSTYMGLNLFLNNRSTLSTFNVCLIIVVFPNIRTTKLCILKFIFFIAEPGFKAPKLKLVSGYWH